MSKITINGVESVTELDRQELAIIELTSGHIFKTPKSSISNGQAQIAKYLGLLLSIINNHHESLDLTDSEVRAKDVAYNLIKEYQND